VKTKEGDRRDPSKFSSIIESQERALIIDALKETRGNQSQAAKLLGTTKRIIQYKIQKFAIDPWRFRPKRNGSTPVRSEKGTNSV
jgi:Nif-specific regulatory protein